MPITQTKDKNIGEIFRIACIRCIGKTDHAVAASYQIRGDDEQGDWSYSWCEDYQVIQCQGCKSLGFRLAKSNSEDHVTDEEGETIYPEDVSLFPPRIEGHKGLGADAYLLPVQLRRVYDETHKALTNQAPVLAGIGLRALVESVCKDNNAAGKNLQEKIDDLVKLAILTPGDAAVLHKVRTMGNAAAHETKPHTESQLQLALLIVEHLLHAVYILPRKAEAEFGEV
jgi:hypothetical protein